MGSRHMPHGPRLDLITEASPGDLVKMQVLRQHWARRWDRGFCVSNKLPGDG